MAVADFVPSWLLSRNVITAVSVAGAALLTYAIYFDYRRRHDPAFRRNIAKERRLAAAERKATKKDDLDFLGEGADPEDMEKFFVGMLQRGDQYIQQGPEYYPEAAACFLRALQVYREPQQLLGLLQSSVPPQVFALVLKGLQELQSKEGKIEEIEVVE